MSCIGVRVCGVTTQPYSACADHLCPRFYPETLNAVRLTVRTDEGTFLRTLKRLQK
jgi:hypothetical protein